MSEQPVALIAPSTSARFFAILRHVFHTSAMSAFSTIASAGFTTLASGNVPPQPPPFGLQYHSPSRYFDGMSDSTLQPGQIGFAYRQRCFFSIVEEEPTPT